MASRLSIVMVDSANTEMLDAALEYAKRGWHVIPLWWPLPNGKCGCNNPDCEKKNSQGKHPIIKDWPNAGTTDTNKITSWWAKWPRANIGILTGKRNGLLLLDVDLKGDGPGVLVALEQENSRLPDSVEAITGSGGRHVLFKYPVTRKIPNKARFQDGLDTRSDGGMFVAAPSLHVSGGRYEWDVAYHPEDIALADCPEWLLRYMCEADASVKGPAKNLKEVEFIKDGSRNDTLFKIACGWRNLPGMTEPVILSALFSLNEERCKPPLDASELELIAKSAGSYQSTAAIHPIRKPDVGNINSYEIIADVFPQTDYGNAERLILHYGADLRWDTRRSKWLHWNNQYWELDESGAVTRIAKDVARQLYDEVSSIDDSTARREAIKYARGCESRAKILAMIELSKSLKGVTILPDQLDNDPWKLNVQNGTIDLNTCQLNAHTREDLITRVLSVAYNPGAECPIWLKFLDRVMGGDVDVVRYIQKAIGYSLTGSISEQCIFIPYGEGANGKSVFLSTISSLMGDYAAQTPTSTLTVKKGESVPNDLARLKGKRFVSASESEIGQKLAESLIKQLSGEDKLSVRFLHQEFFEFIPEFKVWLATNHLPQIRGTDNGIWRRIRLIPFSVTIKDDEKDPELTGKLRKELPGILAWAVEGLKLWQEEGLKAPETIAKATSQYREQSDAIGLFIEEECTVAENLKVMAKDIFIAYQNWCEDNEEHTLNKRQFTQRTTERGFVNARGSGGYYFLKGVGLTHKPM